MSYLIRNATPADAAQIAAIYRPIVLETAISFETVPPSPAEIAQRIERAQEHHAWLVAQSGSTVAGYAYGSLHRARPAYQKSVEVSAYVAPGQRGQGIGRALYGALFEQLGTLGFHQAFAGIALPNQASISLHQSVGFESIGVFREVGRKFDRWHDVSWWQRAIK